jgi:hypothetical protein
MLHYALKKVYSTPNMRNTAHNYNKVVPTGVL